MIIIIPFHKTELTEISLLWRVLLNNCKCLEIVYLTAGYYLQYLSLTVSKQVPCYFIFQGTNMEKSQEEIQKLVEQLKDWIMRQPHLPKDLGNQSINF